MNERRRTIACALLTAALATGGCATRNDPAPVIDAGKAAAAADPAAAADALIADGRYAQAAAELERLADEARGAEADQLEIDAAGAYVAAGDLDSARALLDRQPTLAPGDPISDSRAQVMAEIALAEQRPGDALAIVPADLSHATRLHTRLGLAHARARAHGWLGEPVEAARARDALDALLAQPGAMDALTPALRAEAVRLEASGEQRSLAEDNRAKLWASLVSANKSALEAARSTAQDSFGGWIELAENTAPVLTDANALRSTLAFWSQRYPGHPASLAVVPGMLEAAERAGTPPARLALLLPLGGPFEAAGAAVREGFVTAWNADDSGLRPQVDVLDTSASDVVGLYRGSVEQGADFVVGPLRKPMVESILGSGVLTVPTLILNEPLAEAPPPAGAPTAGGDGVPAGESTETPDVAPASAGALPEDAPHAPVFQFTLAPEAEARRVADHAFAAGYRGAAVLAPEGAWGDRMVLAFVERWQAIGGTVVAEQRYDAAASDFGTPVKTLLQVDQSEARARQLRGVVGRYFAFQPNYRQDMDFIFMPSFPVEARLLKPHLSYFAASRVPVFATSHVYGGEPDTRADLDLERIRFGAMPIVLLPTPPEKEMLARISATTRENPADYARLFAFGADAYELAKRVQAMSISEGAAYEGRSGALEVGPGGEIVRRLTWAMFVDGYPLVDGHTRPDPEAPAAPEEPSEPAVPAEVAPAGAGTSAALGPRRVVPAGPPAPGPAVL